MSEMERISDYAAAVAMQNDDIAVLTVWVEDGKPMVENKALDKPDAKYFVLDYGFTVEIG